MIYVPNRTEPGNMRVHHATQDKLMELGIFHSIIFRPRLKITNWMSNENLGKPNIRRRSCVLPLASRVMMTMVIIKLVFTEHPLSGAHWALATLMFDLPYRCSSASGFASTPGTSRPWSLALDRRWSAQAVGHSVSQAGDSLLN